MNQFQKTLIAASVTAVALGSSAATAELSANIGATSNYIWRGVTQSDDGTAVSGGVDYGLESGVYAGTWVSTVDFGGEGDNNEYEQDLYLGYAGEAGDFGYDFGLNRYMYPLADDADFTELYLSGSFANFSAGLAYTVSSDVDDEPGTAESFIDGDLYYYAAADFALPEDFGLSVTMGQYTFEDDDVDGAALDYSHYQIALSKSAGEMGDFALALDKNDLDGTTNGKDNDDPRVSVSWAKTF
ncbi:TorF family putative porin [Thiohalomonas denitrificans]|uniref:TorF family putative porin n=1 Tax=Thiohalomonas denitrificans TaxID=415747 RepID=UPI0026EE433D|nr:TorF family putative porin [Thiohalomonas denitrificans]